MPQGPLDPAVGVRTASYPNFVCAINDLVYRPCQYFVQVSDFNFFDFFDS